MGRTKIDYGIDLGTTNSAIVRMESGEPKIKKTDTLKDTMPSCVFFNKKKSISIGDSAYNSYKRDKLGAMRSFKADTSNAFIEFKRTMGTDKIFHSSFMEKDYSSEELSSEILKTLKSFITDDEVSSAVITVPAKFNTTQIDATQKAAELAGFSHVELLQEPIAASMAYGLDASKTDGFWLVFDFGGGTFDSALIKVEEGIMKVVDTEGDNHLGGKDLDYAVVDNLIIPFLKKEFSIENILNDEVKKNILRDAMKFYGEQAKIQLSFNETYDILTDIGEIPGTDDDGEEFELDFTITREDFKTAVEPIFQQAIDVCKDLVNRNNIKGSDLATVLLVGGPTYSPLLRSMLNDQLSKNVNTNIDPMTAVAAGAALYASTREMPSELQNRDLAKIQLDLKYEPTSVELEEFITIHILREKTSGNIPESLLIELVRADKGWSSGKLEIDGDSELIEVVLEPSKANSFSIITYDAKGTVYDCEPNEITIIQGSKIGSATLPMNIGIELKDNITGLIRFKTISGLEKNTSLPAIGKTGGLKTQKQIRPGNKEDFIKIPLYEGDTGADGSKAINNEHIKDVIITGEDLPKLLPSGSDVELTINVDTSRRNKFEVYFPFLDETIELDVETSTKSSISAEKLETEISKAINSVKLLNESSNSVDENQLSTIESSLNDLNSMLNNGREDDDNRNKILDKLRRVLKNIDTVGEASEWPTIKTELKELITRLDEINQEFGDNNTSQIVSKYKEQVNDVLNEENTQLAKELMDQIRNLNFALMDQGAGVALDITMIKGFDDEFNTHDWSNINQARALLNQAKQIISTNPTKASLRPIVVGLYDLLPNLDRPITEDDDETVLTN
jgi:molecular chaperone DnaK